MQEWGPGLCGLLPSHPCLPGLGSVASCHIPAAPTRVTYQVSRTCCPAGHVRRGRPPRPEPTALQATCTGAALHTQALLRGIRGHTSCNGPAATSPCHHSSRWQGHCCAGLGWQCRWHYRCPGLQTGPSLEERDFPLPCSSSLSSLLTLVIRAKGSGCPHCLLTTVPG